MLDAGATTSNPRTGSEWTLVDVTDDRFTLRYNIPDGVSQPEIAAHYHIGWHEEFDIEAGEGTCRLGNETRAVKAGETVVMPERIKHVHPYSNGAAPMVVVQRVTLSDPAPNAVRETIGFFFTMFEWEAQGRIRRDRVGLPLHPMKLALAGRILGRAGGYDARFPKALADFGAATLGRLAEGLGYQVIDPKWR